MHNVLLIYLILEHTEAEKEEESALRTPTPESDEPTEGTVFIHIDELYLYVKKIKVRMPVKMCKKHIQQLGDRYYCKLLYSACILQVMNKQCKCLVSLRIKNNLALVVTRCLIRWKK